MRHVPSACTTAGMRSWASGPNAIGQQHQVARRFGPGRPAGKSNQSAASSSSTEAANGRNASRCLMRWLSRWRTVGDRRSAKSERFPRPPRPELHASLKPGHDPALGQHARRPGIPGSGICCAASPHRARAASTARSSNSPPRKGVRLRPAPGRRPSPGRPDGGPSPTPPTAVPASCGAAQMCSLSKGPSRSNRLLATQFVARRRCRRGLSRLWPGAAAGPAQQGLLGAPLHGGRHIGKAGLCGRLVRLTSRSEERFQAGHVPGTEAGQVEVDGKRWPAASMPGRSPWASASQTGNKRSMAAANRCGSPSAASPITFAASGVLPEAQIHGHPLPQHADGMRVGNLFKQFQPHRAASTKPGGRRLADAVHNQHGRPFQPRRIKTAGSMAPRVMRYEVKGRTVCGRPAAAAMSCGTPRTR